MNRALIFFLQIFLIISCETGGGGSSNPMENNLTATFLVDKRCYVVNEEIQFDNISEGEGEVLYYWNFGDNTNSKVKNPTHYYSEPGEYFPMLTISKNSQYDTYKFKILIVEESSPNVGIELSDTLIKLGNTIAFKSNQPEELEWNLDENITHKGISGGITYSLPGKKVITAKSSDGNIIFEKNVYVYNASITPNEIKEGENITLAFNGDFEVRWRLPDGTYLSGESVSAKISSTGNQKIELYSAPGNRLIDSFVVNVKGKAVPVTPPVTPTKVTSAEIDGLLLKLADPSLTIRSKDNVATEMENHFAEGESAQVTGKFSGELYELITKIRIESSPYINVSIKTRPIYDSNGKITQLEILDYIKNEL